MAALAGAGVGAALGGLTGALVGMCIPEYEAKRYDRKIKQGNILISVHSENSDEVKCAKDIFERVGAHDISYTEEKGVPQQEERRAVQDRACCGSAGSKGERAIFRRNYEDFIEDHGKRDGRDRLDPAMGDRHSHTDITLAVHGARLHIIKKFLVRLSRPVRIEIAIDSQLFFRGKTNECFRTS